MLLAEIATHAASVGEISGRLSGHEETMASTSAKVRIAAILAVSSIYAQVDSCQSDVSSLQSSVTSAMESIERVSSTCDILSHIHTSPILIQATFLLIFIFTGLRLNQALSPSNCKKRSLTSRGNCVCSCGKYTFSHR